MHRIFSIFRSCPFCGVTVEPIFGLCRQCRGKLLTEASETELVSRKRAGLLVCRLVEWVPYKISPIGCLLRSLKGGGQRIIYQIFAQRFFLKYLQHEGEEFEQYIFVPAPSKKNGVADHAYAWAEALSEVFDGEIAPVLERSSKIGQRKKSRLGRENIEFVLNKRAWNILLNRAWPARVIFVDDVITTGSTAKAASKSLGIVGNFEVWVMADRTDLL